MYWHWLCPCLTFSFRVLKLLTSVLGMASILNLFPYICRMSNLQYQIASLLPWLIFCFSALKRSGRWIVTYLHILLLLHLYKLLYYYAILLSLHLLIWNYELPFNKVLFLCYTNLNLLKVNGEWTEQLHICVSNMINTISKLLGSLVVELISC